MKIVVEIPDNLLEEARQVAEQEGTGIEALVEEGLRTVLAKRTSPSDFRLRKVIFKGRGLQASPSDATCGRIRDMAYWNRQT